MTAQPGIEEEPGTEHAPRPRDRLTAAVSRGMPTGYDLVLVLTLLLLVLYTAGVAAVIVQSLAIAALIHRPLARRPGLWIAITAALLVDLPYAWYVLVNHSFLIIYWCLALAVALRSDRPARVMATSARLLIGLVFLFAVTWKVLSPDYLSGDFFAFTLVTDERFAVVSETLGGAPPGATERNRTALETWHTGGDTPAIELETGPNVALIATAMTWWGLTLEAVIALLFLLPPRSRGPTRRRELLLLVFVATTYPVAPVVSFAWILLILGLAQSTWRPPAARTVYPLVFVALWVLNESSAVWDVIDRLIAASR